MKSYNEIAENVFNRREEYETVKRRNRKILTRTLTPICCVCIVALLGIGAWHGGVFKNQTTPIKDDTVLSGTKDNLDEDMGRDNSESSNNRIVINYINGIPSGRTKINVFADDFVKMNKSEINEYYGIDIFPSVPSDLEEWDDENHGIYRRNGGIGEVYWDQMVLNYDNKDFSRSVNMEVKKGSLPILDYGFGNSPEEKSIINNREVDIGYSEYSGYFAIFMYNNVGFCVNGDGLTQDEFVSVLSSIIK